MDPATVTNIVVGAVFTAFLGYISYTMKQRDNRILLSYNKLDTKVDKLDTKVDNLGTKVDNLEIRVKGLETKVDKLDTKVDNLDTKVDNLEIRVKGLETKVEAHGTAINNLTNNTVKLETQVETTIEMLKIFYAVPDVPPANLSRTTPAQETAQPDDASDNDQQTETDGSLIAG